MIGLSAAIVVSALTGSPAFGCSGPARALVFDGTVVRVEDDSATYRVNSVQWVGVAADDSPVVAPSPGSEVEVTYPDGEQQLLAPGEAYQVRSYVLHRNERLASNVLERDNCVSAETLLASGDPVSPTLKWQATHVSLLSVSLFVSLVVGALVIITVTWRRLERKRWAKERQRLPWA